MKTRNGVYIGNLKESEYTYVDTELGYVFYFSSKLYLEKFKKVIDEYIERETLKLFTKYNLFIDLKPCLLIAMYRKIEKRGFCVFDAIKKEDVKETQIFATTLR